MTNYVGPQWLKLRNSMPGFKRATKDLSTQTLPIFAVDPGGTTGWSLLVLSRLAFDNGANQEQLLRSKVNWWHGQIDCIDENYGAYQLKKILEKWPSAAVVFEGFNLRQLAVDLSPVRLTAIIQNHLWYKGKEILKQTAAQAKTTATDARLKVWGCYTSEGGLQHARDADRHALLFMRRCMLSKPLSEAAWPHIYGVK